jgi:hypothetical protein
MIRLIPVLLALLLADQPDCNVSSQGEEVCEPYYEYSMYMPIVQYSPVPYMERWAHDLTDWDHWRFCEQGTLCQEPFPEVPATFNAPEGFVISLVRLYSDEWTPPEGAHLLFPWDGCIWKMCVTGITTGHATVFFDYGREGYGPPIKVIDVCYEREGFSYAVLCDSSWLTKGRVP